VDKENVAHMHNGIYSSISWENQQRELKGHDETGIIRAHDIQTGRSKRKTDPISSISLHFK
jgi:hypothetical protein